MGGLACKDFDVTADDDNDVWNAKLLTPPIMQSNEYSTC